MNHHEILKNSALCMSIRFVHYREFLALEIEMLQFDKKKLLNFVFCTLSANSQVF